VGSLNEVVTSRVHLSFSSDFHIINNSIKVFVIGVLLVISLEIITVRLLLFSEASKEESVVVSPSLTLSIEHAVLTSLVVFGVREFTSVEFFNTVKLSVESANSFFNLYPGLVVITAIWDGELNSLGSELVIDGLVSQVHGVELLVSLLGSLQLVGRVDQNAISLIRVDVNVNISG
jgi:hypothetical protein